MPENKPSLEDILHEYSPDSPNVSVGRVDAQKILNSTIEKPDISKLAARSKPAVMPDDNIKVTVVDPDAMGEIRSAPKLLKPLDAEPARISPNDSPQIRRMSDSTRAKEAQNSRKKKKKARGKKNDYTYNRETPDGEYMYTPPSFTKKKKNRAAILAEFENPEGRRQITDIVPSPTAVIAAGIDPNKPLNEYTEADLKNISQTIHTAINIDIDDNGEFTAAKNHKKRTKRIVDFNYYGDVEDVGRDIYELRNTISTRVVILVLTSFISLYITLCNQFRLPIASFLTVNHAVPYLVVHLVLGVISMIASFPVMTKGLKKLITFKADGDSMTAATVTACLISIIPALFSPQLIANRSIHIYMPVGILALLFNACGKKLIMMRAARNFKFVSKNFDRHGVTYVMDEERAEKITRGTLGDFPILASMRKTDFLTDFLRYTYSSDMTDQYCRKAAPAVLVFSVIASIFLTYFCKGTFLAVESASFGFSVFSLLVSTASCISMPLVCNIPLELVSRKALRNNDIMLGYQSVDDFYDTNSILVDAESLFPVGTVHLSDIKVFSNVKLDETLLEAASLTAHSGSIMVQLFEDVIRQRNGALYRIENYSFEEGLGMCGWISNKRVLFGSRQLMTSHNIEGLPTKTKEAEYITGNREALYLSISGNLAAMFIVEITPDRSVRKWAKQLIQNKICIFVKSVDPCITSRKLFLLYGIPESMSRVLPQKLHADFNEETKKVVRLSASMATTGRFTSLAQLIIGTKSVHFSAIVGLILQSVSIILGFALCIALIMSKAFQSANYGYLSAASISLYNIIWAVITYVAVKMKKD